MYVVSSYTVIAVCVVCMRVYISYSITNGSKLSGAGYIVFKSVQFSKGMNGLIRLSMNSS